MNHTFENNGLIADFMGKPRHQEYKTYFRVDNEDGSVGVIHPEEFKFHTSWDWLMPVVEKCFKDAHEDDFFEISGSLPDMDATYKAVVEFINNTQSR